jgi:D-alanine-D-alanine ligase
VSAARAAHRALGLRGLSRGDLRLDARGRPGVLEVNPDATLEPAVTRDEGGLLAASLRAAGRSWSWVIAQLLAGART